MEFLTTGRALPCLDSKAGVKSVKLGKWQPNIGTINNNELSLDVSLDLFEYEARDVSVNSTIQHNDEGEIYEFDITIDLTKVTKEDSKNINTLSDHVLIAFIKNEEGILRVYGIDSGLDISVSETSGGAKSSFSGYNLKLEGESEFIPFTQSVSPSRTVLVLGDNIILTLGNNEVLTL